MVLIEFIVSFAAAFCGSFIYYCEKLQLLPLTFKGLFGRLGAAFLLAGGISFLILRLIRKTLSDKTGRELMPIFIMSLILSVCVMVWFPLPDTGIYPEHTLTVRGLSDESGEFHPVTLTWLNFGDRDVSLSSVQCSGSCRFTEYGPELSDDRASLSWTGKTGNTATIEFISGADQGTAEFAWDDVSRIAGLNNSDFSRLSFEHVFSPANALPEFIACFLILFLFCLAACSSTVFLLPVWNFRAFAAGAITVFVLFRIIQILPVSAPPAFVDSEFYLGQSRFSFSEIFRGAEYCRTEDWDCLSRPILIALVYKICGQDYRIISAFQLIVSLFSWSFFAVQAARLCKSDSGKKTVLILNIGLACTPNISCWDSVLMSESLSLSTSVLMMGSLFWLISPNGGKTWQWCPAVFTAVSALLFVNSRDSSLWSVILVVIILLLIIGLRQNKKVIVSLVCFLAAVCLITAKSTGDRWVYSFENVLFNRILRDPQGERFFIDAGMPSPQDIGEFYGIEHVMIYPKFNSEEFRPLREWILSDGLKTYARYLLRNPMEALRVTWDDGFEKEAFERISYKFTSVGFSQILPDPVVKFFSCNIPALLLIGLAMVGLFPLILTPGGERYAFPVLFVLSAYLLSTAAYLADECDTDRHMMGIITMMKAAAWPLFIMLCEDAMKAVGTCPQLPLNNR